MYTQTIHILDKDIMSQNDIQSLSYQADLHSSEELTQLNELVKIMPYIVDTVGQSDYMISFTADFKKRFETWCLKYPITDVLRKHLLMADKQNSRILIQD